MNPFGQFLKSLNSSVLRMFKVFVLHLSPTSSDWVNNHSVKKWCFHLWNTKSLRELQNLFSVGSVTWINSRTWTAEHADFLRVLMFPVCLHRWSSGQFMFQSLSGPLKPRRNPLSISFPLLSSSVILLLIFLRSSSNDFKTPANITITESCGL